MPAPRLYIVSLFVLCLFGGCKQKDTPLATYAVEDNLLPKKAFKFSSGHYKTDSIANQFERQIAKAMETKNRRAEDSLLLQYLQALYSFSWSDTAGGIKIG
jgi:hypothetical protein